MKPKILNLMAVFLTAATILPGAFLTAPAGKLAAVCGQTIYLPLISKAGVMAKTEAIESIESLLRRQTPNVQDARIVEIFPESVTVRPVGGDEIRANVPIPGHIDRSKLIRGQAVRLGTHQGQPILLAVLDQFDEDANYSGLGYPLPTPPQIHVTATKDGWLVSWPAVPGATGYHLYRNDTPDETSPDDLGITTETAVVAPYESPFIYFAVSAISGLNESEVSGWVTDSDPPPVPDSFSAANDINGHRLVMGGDDAALNDPGLKCFEIEIADDDQGTNAASLGQFFLSDFPVLRRYGAETIKWYRVRAIDFAGNNSDWSDWDKAVAGYDSVQDRFDRYGYGPGGFSDQESLYWLGLDNVDDGWDKTAILSGAVEGKAASDSGVDDGDGVYGGGFSKIFSPALDFTGEQRFSDDDYVVFAFWASEEFNDYGFPAPFGQIAFNSVAGGSSRFAGFISVPDQVIPSTWNYIKIKRGSFVAEDLGGGAPSWDHIESISVSLSNLDGTPNASWEVRLDDLRIVKADPDDPDEVNDTGGSWKWTFGPWHIREGNREGEPSKPFSFGPGFDPAFHGGAWYIAYKPLDVVDIITGSVQAGIYIKENDGQAGVAFFVKAVSMVDVNGWTMYAVEADSAGDTIKLVKWVSGTRTVIATESFLLAANEIFWLAADFSQYDSDNGRIKVYASKSEGGIISADNLIISAQDTEIGSGGSVGLISDFTNVRFVNFTAGSPAHAEVADVAKALDGVVIASKTKRVRYSSNTDLFEKSEDGLNWLPTGLVGLYNYFCNSQFVIDQQGNAGGAAGSGAYIVDQYAQVFSVSGGTVTGARSTTRPANPKSPYSLSLAVTGGSYAAASYAFILNPIEGYYVSDFILRGFYYSFQAMCTVSGTYALSFRDGGSTVSYIVPLTLTANTWQHISGFVPAPSIGTWTIDNARRMSVSFVLAAGSTYQNATTEAWISGNYLGPIGMTNPANATVYITEPMLSPYTHSFHPNPYGIDHDWALRYFHRAADGSRSANEQVAAGMVVNASHTIYFPFRYPVIMRSAPSLIASSPSHFRVWVGGGGALACATLGGAVATTEAIRIQVSLSGSSVDGRGAVLEATNASATLDLDARM